jgi:hypothetical protein
MHAIAATSSSVAMRFSAERRAVSDPLRLLRKEHG